MIIFRDVINTAKGVDTMPGENNDCTVRALANAAGLPYEEAHAHMAKFGRKKKHGMHLIDKTRALESKGFVIKGIYGTTNTATFARRRLPDAKVEKGTTLKKLLKQLAKGRFVVSYKGHALAVVDGKVIDDGAYVLANKRVVQVLELQEFCYPE